MTVALGIMATIIFFMYSTYFIRIIQGRPQAFEMEILKALAEWMVHRGTSSKGQLWGMYLLSILLELVYFVLVFYIIPNPAMQMITVAFAGAESVHFIGIGRSFSRFFKGKIKINQLFNWKMERMSVTLFFTHSMLVLISLFFFL